ncbi:MAG: hypothetical protein QF760_04360, partial [Candidatus Thalassarchaeaceae archaeon]|nr:hypothetical protein [Candidatus Thalassarchaeaceae archaeon]
MLVEPEGENRVAIVPNSVPKLSKLGINVIVESGAGSRSNYSDEDYTSKGAVVGTRIEALETDLLVSINMPDPTS